MAGTDERYTATGSGTRARQSKVTTASAGARWLIAIVLFVFLAGCSNPLAQQRAVLPTPECLASLKPVTSVTSLHVQPDAGLDPILDEINQAHCTIDIFMYLFSADEVFQALANAEKRGIRVRVILESEPFVTFNSQPDTFEQLQALGAEVHWAPARFQYGHAKYMVTDGQTAVITSQNFTGSGFLRNREYGVVTTDPAYVQQAQSIFDADWEDVERWPIDGPLVVSPGNARERVMSLINSADVQLWMYAEVLRDEEITTALNTAVDRGVDVRVIVNPSSDEESGAYFTDAMDHHVQIRELEEPFVHAKLMIVDGREALVGSHNYSYTSLNLNREIGVVLTDETSLQTAMSTFERDWARAVPVDRVSLTPGMTTYRMYVQSLGADSRMHVRR